MLVNLAQLLQKAAGIAPVLIIPGYEGTLIDYAKSLHLKYELVSPLPWYIYGSEIDVDYQRSVRRAAAELEIVLRETISDVVLINTLTSIPATLAAIKLNLPTIVWIHGVMDSSLLPVSEFPNRDASFQFAHDHLVLQTASAIIANSTWTKKFYEGKFGYDAIRVIYNWSSTDHVTPVEERKYRSGAIRMSRQL